MFAIKEACVVRDRRHVWGTHTHSCDVVAYPHLSFHSLFDGGYDTSKVTVIFVLMCVIFYVLFFPLHACHDS